MMIVEIKNLRVSLFIGQYDYEQQRKRDVFFNIKLGLLNETAANTDLLKDTVDYELLCQKIETFVEDKKFRLLEKLVKSICEIILQEPRITWTEVQCIKTGAVSNTDYVALTIREKRD